MIAGAARAGKTEALRRLAAALAGQDGLEVSVVLAGVRPEEIAEWQAARVEPGRRADASPRRPTRRPRPSSTRSSRAAASPPAAATPSCSSTRSTASAAGAARRALAAARAIVDGGSLTVIATAPAPLGGETTVVALDAALHRARAASRRSTSPPAARCARSCWSATPAPRRSPRRARRARAPEVVGAGRRRSPPPGPWAKRVAT